MNILTLKLDKQHFQETLDSYFSKSNSKIYQKSRIPILISLVIIIISSAINIK